MYDLVVFSSYNSSLLSLSISPMESISRTDFQEGIYPCQHFGGSCGYRNRCYADNVSLTNFNLVN